MDQSTLEMEMTITNDQKNCEDSSEMLANEVTAVKNRIEILQQQLYEEKRSELINKNMVEELTFQLESLQQELNQAEASKEEMIKSQRSQKLNPLKAQLLSLEKERDELEQTSSEKITELKEKLKVLKQNQQDNIWRGEDEKYDSKSQLIREREELTQFIIDQKKILEKTIELEQSEKRLRDKSATLEEYKSILEATRHDLNTINQETKAERMAELEKLEAIDEEEDPSVALYSKEIAILEEKYFELEANIMEIPCSADPSLKSANLRFVKYLICKPWEELKASRKELYDQSYNKMKAAKDLYLTQIKLIIINKALLFEESKQKQLLLQLQEYKRSQELASSEKSYEEEKSSEESTEKENSMETNKEIEPSQTIRSKNNEVNNKTLTQEKQRAQLKFECRQKTVVMSDFDFDSD